MEENRQYMTAANHDCSLPDSSELKEKRRLSAQSSRICRDVMVAQLFSYILRNKLTFALSSV